REVMEEVGLEVENLQYFGSQPWGFSDSVISGFFADLSGSSQVRLDREELSEAVWLHRDEIPKQNNGISITAAMIEAFRTGKF
ncbi:NUDIX domain-containing protein, partial [Pseudomonas aeruginosa]|nr:NUDIX domain-containing protein [Pseudomonas aeruginosa]